MPAPFQVLLVLNVGSSSLKFSLYDATTQGQAPQCFGQGIVETCRDIEHLSFVGQFGPNSEGSRDEWPSSHRLKLDNTLTRLMDWIERFTGATVVAAAHRVVHGGDRSDSALLLDDALMIQLRALVSAAPLHQPRCLGPIAYLSRARPGLRQVACFDTAFHSTLDPLETGFGLPAELTAQGLRRYGFHGISYEYIAGKLAEYDSHAAQGRTIVAHLGHGASLCGLHNRVSRATSMGFSTLDGLLMGTRPGRLDPGVLLYLLRERHMSPQELEDLLYHRCGLLGVSDGLSSDMRELSISDLPQAKAAIALFVRYVIREIGAIAAVLGGLDALVFTGGIGEHATEVRAAILDGCAWLGVKRDRGGVLSSTGCLSQPGSAVTAWVIPTDENRVIAGHALRLLRAPC